MPRNVQTGRGEMAGNGRRESLEGFLDHICRGDIIPRPDAVSERRHFTSGVGGDANSVLGCGSVARAHDINSGHDCLAVLWARKEEIVPRRLLSSHTMYYSYLSTGTMYVRCLLAAGRGVVY